MIIGIVGHEQRQENVDKLWNEVRANVANIDDGTLKCEGSHLVVLEQLVNYPVPVEWSVVLEDDAVPVFDFRAVCDHALESAPAPVVGLYLGTGHLPSQTQQQIKRAVREAKDGDAAWILADCLIGSVGYAIKTELIADLIDFSVDRTDELPMRITRWAQNRGIAICYTMPSLVDHADGESVGYPWRGNFFPKRKAWWWDTREQWNGVVELGHCPIWSRQEK